MPTRACEVVGVLLWEGNPTAGRVEVWVERPANLEPSGTFLSFDDDGADRARWLAQRTAPSLAVVEVGADGRFAVQGLGPASYAVVATAADGLRAEGTTGGLTLGERSSLELHLRPCPHTLRGHVRYPDGRPAQATVVVRLVRGRWGLEDPWGPAPTTTDGTGRFTVDSLPAGRVLVTAFDASGLQRSGRVFRLPFERDYVLTLDEGAVDVAGRVVHAHDGTPLPGAEVLASLAYAALWPPAPRTTADAHGRFRLRVPASTQRITARAAGFLEVSAGRPWSDLTLRLSQGARLWGRASTPDGAPVAGLRVVASRDPHRASPGGRGERAARTDAEGRYELEGLPAGGYAVSARGEGWVSANFLETDGTRAVQHPLRLGAADVRQVDLPLTRAGRVEGTLLDHTGEPVAGARITASRSHPSRRGNENPLPWSAYGDASDAVATGADGGFAFDSLVPGVEYRIAVHPSGAPATPVRRVVPSAESPVPVVLRLPVPRWVVATVLDRVSGAPIPGASVQVSCDLDSEADPTTAEDTSPFHFRSFTEVARGRTDRGGRARLGPVGVGRLIVSASADGYVEADDAQAAVDGGGPSLDATATVRLERGRRIHGRALLPDGTPAEAATVTLRHDRRGGGSTFVGSPVDEAGSFEFLDVGSGTYVLEARVDDPTGDYETEAPVPPPGTDIALRLAKGPGPRKLVVRVVDPDGQSVDHADVRFQTGHGGRGSFFRNGRAEFDLTSEEGTGEVTGTVTVERARDANGSPLPVGRAVREGVRSGQVIEVRLVPELVIEGRVVDPEGQGVPGAKVRADRLEPGEEGDAWRSQPWLWNIADAFLTDASGAFRIGHLGAGDHEVHVLPPATFATPASARAEAGRKGLEIRLVRGVAPVITVVDDTGQPVPNARVVVAKREGPRDFVIVNLFQHHSPGWELTTGSDGSVPAPGLDGTATYALGVRPPEGRLDLAEHVEPSWPGVARTVRLARGLSAAGVLRDAEGKPVANAWVMCRRENGVETSTTTSEDGTFRFTRLAPGTVELRGLVFAGSVRDTRRTAPKAVPAGTEDVVLSLED